jgi:peptidoglycan/xylan/chitin deacetylase (PgdA/CDA1 family)
LLLKLLPASILRSDYICFCRISITKERQVISMEFIYSLLFIYSIFPNIYYRFFSNIVLRKVHAGEKVLALTFDDGPDPEYTPLLLDVLKENDVKGTFFVLADKASKYPDIVRRMIQEGHNIGLHSFRHINEAFLSPLRTKKELFESLSILNELNVKVNLFRPPWGIFNLMTCHYAMLCKCKIVLWSIHAKDWSRYTSVEYIKHRLINKVKPGDIVLLHDGGGAKGAPRRTIAALKAALPVLKSKGYRFVLAKDL